ncbi:hypothetical protein FLAV_02823 [Flavobacteriales bacterium]|nr:hypothetical protein [Candidatus Methanoperedens sp.]CAG0999140.1 hypothetical protein FLAV_02823 [Flavobacteriales bacterium]
MSNKKTRWERIMEIFYTRSVASLGMNFVPALYFCDKPVISICISQHVLSKKANICPISSYNKTVISEPTLEMNGIFAWHEQSGTLQAIEVGKDLLSHIISLVNSPTTRINSFYADILLHDINFLNRDAYTHRIYFSTLEELESSSSLDVFKVHISDDLRAIEPMSAHLYFEPKIRKLIELIKIYSDASGKADAEVVHTNLTKALNLGSEETWAVFDYAVRFNVFVEVDQRYAVLTGKTVPSIPEHHENP